jgi:clorobiocin biosynthesis protein CloN6
MEDWIEQVLPLGVHAINVWFFIGMPKQTTQSVFDTVEFCRSLLKKFKGRNVIPVICAMVPFLDPGSTFFVEPEKHGYRIFHRSVEEHRKAMLSVSLKESMNYETNWMTRDQIIYTSYEAVKRLVLAKAEVGMLPKSLAANSVKRIDEAVEIMHEIDDVLSIENPGQKNLELASLTEKIRAHNRRMVSGRSDQILPKERGLDQRWFDEFEFNPEAT